jgi:hypothetical protein
VEVAITLETHAEWLRQKTETFDQQKKQDARSFRVSQAIAWTSVALIPLVAVFCAYVIISTRFEHDLKALAAATLLGDIVGLAGITWKVSARRGAPPRLAPTLEPPALSLPSSD